MRLQASILSLASLFICLLLLSLWPRNTVIKNTRVEAQEAFRPVRLAECQKIDFHTHFDPGAERRALILMDQFNISCAVNLTGMPAGDLLQPYLDMESAFSGRLLTFAGIDWRLLKHPHFGEAMADNLREAIKQGARGLKIPKALGLMIPAPEGGLLRIDDPRLDPIFETAGQLGVPIAIHAGDPVAFWEPIEPANPRYDELKLNPNWSYHKRPVPSHGELMQQQVRLFERHPKTTFVAVHVAGYAENIVWVDELLERLPNVFIDVAARVPELGRQPTDTMRAFFIKNENRILFGTDLGLGTNHVMLGAPLPWVIQKEDVIRFFDSTWRYFETSDRNFEHPTPIQGQWTINGLDLPISVQDKLYRKNAIEILSSRTIKNDK